MQNRCSVDRINVWFGSLACDFFVVVVALVLVGFVLF